MWRCDDGTFLFKVVLKKETLIYLRVHVQRQTRLVSEDQVDDGLQDRPQEGVDAEH